MRQLEVTSVRLGRVMAWLATAGLVACAAVGPFDSQVYLRQQFALQVGSTRAAQIEVPFALDETTRAAIEKRVRPSGSEVQRANEITSFIFDSLDLVYEAMPTRNAVETFRDRRGNCLSFVNLFMGVARLQRLNAFYVEVEDAQSWSYSHGTVVSQGHIVAGLSVGGELEIYDFMPESPKSYRKFKPIDDLLATAHYFNNLGAEALLAGDVERALARVRLAAEIAPHFDKALNNLGVVLARRGELDAAAAAFQRGLEAAPESEAVLTNLLRTYQQLGRAGDAEAVFARLDQQRVSNPLYFVYKGERALARGDTRTALEQMTEALRRGSDIAEVHVGLAKVYIALGDLDKARHHLGRALRLDAAQAEARRLERMLGDER